EVEINSRKLSDNAEANFNIKTNEIEIYAPIVTDIEKFNENLLKIKSNLHHEIEHFLQFNNTDINFGLPSSNLLRKNLPRVRFNKKVTKEEKEHIKYLIDDFEFYPQITSATDDFNRKYRKLPSDVKKVLARIYVDLDPLDTDST